MDPGERRITIEWHGRKEERLILLTANEHGRPLDVAFGVSYPPSAASASSSQFSEDQRPIPWTVFASAGLALGALGSFTFFAVDGRSRLDELDASGCRPFCRRSDVDAVDRSALVADISLIVSVVAAGAAVAFFATRPRIRSPR